MRFGRRAHAPALFGLATALAFAAACNEPTEISVDVTSDLPCSALRGVAIAAGAPSEIDTRAPSATTMRCDGSADGSRVGNLVIVPSSAKDVEVGIRVTVGIDRSVSECSASDGFRGCIVARRIVRFESDATLKVNVALRSACRDVACDAASTCVRGECKSARLASASCQSGCDEGALGGPALAPPDAGIDANSDAGPIAPASCAPDEKSCDGKCVKKIDAAYGCSDGTCAPCAGSGVASSVCIANSCALQGCAFGYKLCGGNCVPVDALHGCRTNSCSPCEATNATATCTDDGACALVCNGDSKFCAGKCVRKDDPTYGCGGATCDDAQCPDPGSGTVVCKGNACAIGECAPGTKKCGNKCVPTDPNNGCADPARCTACATGEVCQGTPSVCTCVPEPLSTTCATKACGKATNNCGIVVDCPDTCALPNKCGDGGAGPNGCGCTPDNVAACAGKACGPAVNNCGQTIECPNTCTGYNTCGGGSAGPNGCGCTPIPKGDACQEPCGKAFNGCGGYWTCGTTICK